MLAVILIVVAALIVVIGGCAVLAVRAPQTLQRALWPLQALQRWGRLRRAMERRAAKRMARHPELIEQLAARVGSPAAGGRLREMLESQDPQERERTLERMMQQAAAGELEPLPVVKGRDGSGVRPERSARTQARKAKDRARRKQARKQRRR